MFFHSACYPTLKYIALYLWTFIGVIVVGTFLAMAISSLVVFSAAVYGKNGGCVRRGGFVPLSVWRMGEEEVWIFLRFVCAGIWGLA